jgi:DNA uptake protein ComE-like DNA-binding protein
MKLHRPTLRVDGRRNENGLVATKRSEGASVLIIVLWIAIGLVSIALYFAHSMTFELRASDNRTSGLATEQAIEGAARYVSHVLSNFATNGAVPLKTQFSCEAVALGDAHFWIIGRDPSGTVSTKPYFGLIDEGSKLNLNTANTNALSYLPNMAIDIANAIVDWRSTNGSMSLSYAQLGYLPKHAMFETVDEVRLVDGATFDLLTGADINRNGVLDTNEKNVNGTPDYGILEYLTIYSREPNFHADGSSLTNANTQTDLRTMLQSRLSSSRATQIMSRLFPNNGGGGRGGGAGGGATGTTTYSNPLQFYLNSGMTLDELAQIYNDLTFTSGTYIRGRVNINTASVEVLNALFLGVGSDQNTASGAAEQLVSYREQNLDKLSTVAWIVDALGSDNAIVRALARADYITTHSYQFTADIAATGPFGRGYRRVKFIFDISDGTPKIIYRQDLSRLGWALGDTVRETWLAKETQ